ncbi:MAG: redox-regulated ATPase YchF [Defluviitaleaceae bacterium]|nr:redox-regulated ATPase YchF [Defluviitaleaceae bacterium]
MKLGIVGLPNSGKSTIFNAIMHAGAEAAFYPFSTVNPNTGMVPVPDNRLQVLYEMYKAKAVTPATLEMVDIAGLVKGSGRGEGLGNQFLSHIREVDAIVHVVRCFTDDNVPHVYDGIDPLRDIETVNLELVFADLEIIERKLAKVSKGARTDKNLLREEENLIKLKDALESGQSADGIDCGDLPLLSQKPVLYAANVNEGETENNPHVEKIFGHAKKNKSSVFVSCAKLESELQSLDDEERELFLREMGFSQTGLDRLITAGYELLGLISFLTAGPKEVRAWTIKRGCRAQQAAGKIHSDLERGFIRAEVVAYDDLVHSGTYAAAKERGLVRSEGKEYVVKDGDVMLIRFNV